MQQQHPVPQHIASYEFRLVGDMTLKQFLQVAGGGLIALLFYAAPLPVIIKWPLIFLSSVSGAAMAFLPFEERPLSAWFIAFIRAIYSPTKYAYQEGKTLDIFAPETGPVSAADVAATPGGEARAEVYLSTPAAGDEPEIKKFEEEEQSFFQKALSLFHLTKGEEPTPAPTIVASPSEPRPQLVVEEVKDVSIPQNQPVAAPAPVRPAYETSSAQPYNPQVAPVFTPAPRRGPGRPRLTTPKFEIAATPPAAPRTPNVIVGQILDHIGNTVEAAILEIKDSEGRPVRALRSNRVGHFLTATPLLPGTYEVLTEKDGFIFDPIQVLVSNEIIPPIEIRAKSTN
ncbi:PrgI family protein [Candidatus Microgenomates bacterium]|nr:PrgI family protein [Candidatus Microgenomates bacterium]